MVEVKTNELSGAALDWAVGQVEALPIEFCKSDAYEERHYCFFNRSVFDSRGVRTFCSGSIWFPSTNWSQGGLLIDKYKLEIIKFNSGFSCVKDWDKDRDLDYVFTCWPIGETHLIAACRAIVAAKLGDTVQVPAELLTNG